MDTVAEVLRYANIALLLSLAAVAFRQWRKRGDAATRWVALTFATLAGFFVLAAATDGLPEGDLLSWAEKVFAALALVFPYFLYRFTASFSRPSTFVEWLALALTAAVVAWALLLPDLPESDAPRPLSFQLFVAAALVQWTVLSLLVAFRLWRAGRGQSTVPRYRMRILSVASMVMSAAIVLAGAVPSDDAPWADLAFRLLVFASASLFFVGFAPPAWLREAWRRPEVEKLRGAVADLMGATNPAEVTANVLPQMAGIVGARGVALIDGEGRMLGSHGVTDEMAQDLEAPAFRAPATPENEARDRELIRLELRSGTLAVWTSPYAPFFGSEEFDLLASLGALTDLALDRSRLFEHEREARVALEQADRIKSHFIALASHELRTPVAVIHGIAQTLQVRGDHLRDDQRQHLRETLFEQTDRLRRLVEQLLDSSRLEAGAIEIKPQGFGVRRRVEDILFTHAGEHARDVRIEVPPELETVADPNAFDRIVSNLITNACRYGEPPVVVSAQQSDRHLRLAVEDRGRGVSPEFVPALFERFSRSDETTDKATGGAGLGLSIAQSYAEAHGGGIFYRQAEPHGARFEVVIPIQRETVASR